MLIAALFIIAEHRKQPKSPTTGKQINKWGIVTQQNTYNNKKEKNMDRHDVDEFQKHYLQLMKPCIREHILCYSIHLKF